MLRVIGGATQPGSYSTQDPLPVNKMEIDEKQAFHIFHNGH